MKSIKICVNVREFIGQRKTGIERHVENLFLPLLADSRIETVFLTHDPQLLPETLRSAGAECMIFPKAPATIVDQIFLTAIETLLRHSSRSDTVRIHKGIDDEDLRALYRAADWTITLSEYEGFGYPVIEAMACSCPVICYPCTSLTEITEKRGVHIARLTESCVYETLVSALEMESYEGESPHRTWISQRAQISFWNIGGKIHGMD